MLKERLAISQDLHDNIGSTLSSIAVYSEVAKIQGEKNGQQDMHDLLEKISATSNEMVTEMNDIVWAINPRNDSMEKIIQRMESFAKPLAAARNMQFDLHYDDAVLLLHLPMDKERTSILYLRSSK
ncbi:MAG: histidine kinase dimerization/phosphoacceptor domain-containing protein [Chitinophagaceae bacterium]|nr:histidine kinase dimerization/phosphoacceptor domain-containing protein [Chitinophagaceae bacterium]